MGKNLKGKECGAGICQRKDGKYTARFLAKDGSRREKHFLTLPEAKNWLADAKYEDKHDLFRANSEMTVDEWYKYWVNNLICDLHRIPKGTMRSGSRSTSSRSSAVCACVM